MRGIVDGLCPEVRDGDAGKVNAIVDANLVAGAAFWWRVATRRARAHPGCVAASQPAMSEHARQAFAELAMAIAEGGPFAIVFHAHDMHPWVQGQPPCMADPDRLWGHGCMDDLAGWVERWLYQAAGVRQAQRIEDLLLRVHTAATRLCDEDARRNAQPCGTALPVTEPDEKTLARAQDDAVNVSEYTQWQSLAVWVRMCGENGRSVVAKAMCMAASNVPRYLRKRTKEAADRAGPLVTRRALR